MGDGYEEENRNGAAADFVFFGSIFDVFFGNPVRFEKLSVGKDSLTSF